jgi:hypothetical protein
MNVVGVAVMQRCSVDFVAFRALWDSYPFTEEAMRLVCDCLNWYVARSGKSLETVERALALYKLKTEMKT